MTLENAFSSIGQFSIPNLNKCNCNTIEDFYNEFGKFLPPKNAVIGWHKILMQYVKDPDAIFFIRRYSTTSKKDPITKKKDWNYIRRGFYTKFKNNAGYVYADNFFAHYFFVMALNNYVPASYKEFKDLIINRKIPYGSAQTKEEVPHQAFPLGKSVNINKKGWKLSHLFSVNEEDYSFDYKAEKTTLFPLGINTEWKIQNGSTYPYKYENRDLVGTERDKIVAHFLRFVHPINYFISPMEKVSTNSVEDDIGEYPELLQYMYLRIKEEYGTVFDEYLSMIYPNPNKYHQGDYNIIGSSIINLEVDPYMQKGKQSATTAVKKAVTPKIKTVNSKSSYCYKGSIFSQRTLALEIVKDFCKTYPNISFTQLKNIFNSTGRPTVKDVTLLTQNDINHKNYFFDQNSTITLCDGTVVAVWTQWTVDRINGFISVASSLGFNIQ